jgi:hypothetical protein
MASPPEDNEIVQPYAEEIQWQSLHTIFHVNKILIFRQSLKVLEVDKDLMIKTLLTDVHEKLIDNDSLTS